MRRAAMLSVLALASCTQSGALFGGRACEPWTTDVQRATPVEGIDLLFVIDTSSDLENVRAVLAAEVPRAIAALTTGDYDRDGVAERTAVGSVHVGVVTADMGTGDVSVPGCSPGVGDDGLLLREGCASGVFAFGGPTSEPAAAVVDCATMLDSSDCPFVQPLGAALRALSPAGHGDGENDGFLRPSSALAIVIVTNDDDCTASTWSTYGDEAVPVGLRCHEAAASLQPIARFVDGLTDLRPDPTRLTFAVIAGIPAGHEVSSYEATLALPALEEQSDPEHPERLLPSCAFGPLMARPPRRLLETARGLSMLGADTLFQSVCEDTSVPILGPLLAHLATQVPPTCVIATPDAQGHLACELVMELPTAGAGPLRCSELSPSGAYDDLGVIESSSTYEPRTTCRVHAIEQGSSEPGWWLDTQTAECAHAVRVSGIEVPATARLVLHCYEPAPLSPTDERACDPATERLLDGSGTCADLGLTCDPFALHCGQRCASNADCASTVCDRHTADAVFSTLRPPRLAPSDVRGYCVEYDTCP